MLATKTKYFLEHGNDKNDNNKNKTKMERSTTKAQMRCDVVFTVILLVDNQLSNVAINAF